MSALCKLPNLKSFVMAAQNDLRHFPTPYVPANKKTFLQDPYHNFYQATTCSLLPHWPEVSLWEDLIFSSSDTSLPTSSAMVQNLPRSQQILAVFPQSFQRNSHCLFCWIRAVLQVTFPEWLALLVLVSSIYEPGQANESNNPNFQEAENEILILLGC